MKIGELIAVSNNQGLAKIEGTNKYTERFGLALCPEDAHRLMESRRESLRQANRVELGDSVLPKLIMEFCDSPYISQSNYVETIARLTDIFFDFKNETDDLMTDDEVLHLMREQFDNPCFGDLDYLEGTVLPTVAEAVRSGERGYEAYDGRGFAAQYDDQERWSQELYYDTLGELMA